MSQPHPTIINGPLNFRTSDTLITTKVPHYPPKSKYRDVHYPRMDSSKRKWYECEYKPSRF